MSGQSFWGMTVSLGSPAISLRRAKRALLPFACICVYGYVQHEIVKRIHRK
jgi:hypothetical protein